MTDAYIGRQPIYDAKLNVVAYELLYRSADQNNAASFLDGNRATTDVIINAFMEIGLDKVVGNLPAFINLTREFLMGHHPLPMPPAAVVLEILEDIEIDAEIVDAVRTLAEAGYQLALDDFVLNDSYKPIFEYIKIVKVELPALSREQIAAHVKELRQYNVKLLAEKIETQEEFEYCKSLGFDLFQGYFLAKPNIIKGKRTPANRLATMRILAKLQQPDTDVRELQELIEQDVTLSYKILRYLNSPSFALPKKIESVKQAVVYLGNSLIKHWATLIVMSGIDDKPIALMNTALFRAKMCELIAADMGIPKTESYSTAGLLSILDALMDKPMDEVIGSLPLSEDINVALSTRSNLIGDILNAVIAYDEGNFDKVTALNHPEIDFNKYYLEAIQWSSNITKDIAR